MLGDKCLPAANTAPACKHRYTGVAEFRSAC